MAFRGGAKRSLGAILCSYRYSFICNGRGFSTRVSNKRAVITQFTETQASNPLRLANAQCGSALFLIRRGCTQGIEEKREGFGIKKVIKMASEGLLSLAQNESTAAIIELNSHTSIIFYALALAKQALLVKGSSQQVPEAIPIALEHYEPSEDLLTSNPTASSHHTR
uniref:elongation factor Ts, mitochondrial-like n=1 Tax=Fragaria vesca subsp. vesca TaxID=101020 RepID=UPI0005CA69EE|nr:PREDICTED: elongation factor Ts, mitochondrial-like [Fragaria vesca subsp. vesca]